MGIIDRIVNRGKKGAREFIRNLPQETIETAQREYLSKMVTEHEMVKKMNTIEFRKYLTEKLTR